MPDRCRPGAWTRPVLRVGGHRAPARRPLGMPLPSSHRSSGLLRPAGGQHLLLVEHLCLSISEARLPGCAGKWGHVSPEKSGKALTEVTHGGEHHLAWGAPQTLTPGEQSWMGAGSTVREEAGPENPSWKEGALGSAHPRGGGRAGPWTTDFRQNARGTVVRPQSVGMWHVGHGETVKVPRGDGMRRVWAGTVSRLVRQPRRSAHSPGWALDKALWLDGETRPMGDRRGRLAALRWGQPRWCLNQLQGGAEGQAGAPWTRWTQALAGQRGPAPQR